MSQSCLISDDNPTLAEILQTEAIVRAREIISASDRELSEMTRCVPPSVLNRMIRGLISQSGPTEQGELARQAAERLADITDLSAARGIHKTWN